MCVATKIPPNEPPSLLACNSAASTARGNSRESNLFDFPFSNNIGIVPVSDSTLGREVASRMIVVARSAF